MHRRICLLLLTAGLGSLHPAFTQDSLINVAPWPEADKLFHQDRRWLGSDGAYSIDLGKERILWLFGDTFIATSDACTRNESRMVRNSIGLQTGNDPSTARISFSWKSSNGGPESFVTAEAPYWYWFGDGIRVGDKLLILLSRMRPVDSGLGFDFVAAEALFVHNPDAAPELWKMVRRPLGDSFSATLSPSALHREGNYVYAFMTRDPLKQEVFLARWTVRNLRTAKPKAPEWWHADSRTWKPLAQHAPPPPPILSGAQAEFTVQKHAGRHTLMLVQTVGFGATDIGVRFSRRPEGPWSPLRVVYRPEEAGRWSAFLYAAKSHAHLTGAEAVLTYATNSFNFPELIRDTTWYYPRFLKASFGGGRGPQ